MALPHAHAQTWPARRIRIVLPFAAGGTGEDFARLVRGDAAGWGKVICEAAAKVE
jgi:tripartite-type tricarboxylate transporter receptor subunit TctC